MRLIILILTGFIFLTGSVSFCQEIESDLVFLPTESSRSNHSDMTVRGGGLPPMALPFLDDFAWPSSFEESGMTRPELVRWDTSPVRRTSTFALNPPTIGVATLDGLDATGYPYQFNSLDAHGWADTLTSRKLLLDGYTASSEVTLSFYFEGGGVGNGPDEGEDTLIVEFKSIGIDGDIWTRVWQQEGFESDQFTQVVIPIDDGVYLNNSFQFRFRNFGTLMGNADLWHIDYVYVALTGATGNPIEELAFREPAYTLLRSFSAMPWTHFSDNPEFYMKDTLVIESNNFGSGPNNQENTGITVRLEAPGTLPTLFTNEFIQNVSVPVGPFSTEFLADLLNTSGSSTNLVFDTSLSDSIATFEVSLWEEEVGFYTDQTSVFDNDSIGYRQVFDNYYAYDDGSAEKAYALDAIGGQIAVRYPIAIPDTLDGIAIHFTPFYENSETHTFVLKVWGDDAGMPGELLDTMYQFHSPQYFTEGHDVFAYYPLDNPVPVSGTIHVGFIQQNVDRLNVGLDKTTNANAGNLHYMLGPGSNWALSEISGSVMIRPVLRAGKELITSVDDITQFDSPEEIVSELFPNPASTSISFVANEPLNWDVISMSGQTVRTGNANFKGQHQIYIDDLSPGVYMIIIRSIESDFMCHKRFIKQH
jgi:hypothetical protein